MLNGGNVWTYPFLPYKEGDVMLNNASGKKDKSHELLAFVCTRQEWMVHTE